MATGAYVAVAVGCSMFGFAAGVAGDLLRQRLGFAAGKVVPSTDVVPDIEQNNLQASFLEPPCTSIESSSNSTRFAVAAAELEGEPEDSSKEAPKGSFSTMDSIGADAYEIADALPYGAADGDEASPQSAALADALPYGAAGLLEDAETDFVPDLSKCLPGCLDPAKGLHHCKCPNHDLGRTAKRAAVAEAEAEEPMSLADRIRQTAVVPYCQSFERKALPYMNDA